MASHSAEALMSEQVLPDGRLSVELLLRCGCLLRATVAPDRVVVDTRGLRFAVGKYPCPKGHLVKGGVG